MDGQTGRQTDRQAVLTVWATLGSVEHIEVNIPEHVLLVERVCLPLYKHVEELLRVLHALLQDLVGLQGALQVHLLLREQSRRKLKVQVLTVRGGDTVCFWYCSKTLWAVAAFSSSMVAAGVVRMGPVGARTYEEGTEIWDDAVEPGWLA